MTTLYILCGYPFAGKSTLAKALIQKFGLTKIAIDEINRELGVGKDFNKPITPQEWQKTYDIYHDRIHDTLKAEKSVIVDTVAHTRKSRDALRKIAHENNAESVVLYVNTPLDIVKERWLKNRIKQEREDVRDTDFNTVINNFEIPSKDENVITIPNDLEIEAICSLLENERS